MNINNYLQPGESINVTASAGTGKTWVIISKILRLLLDGEDPDKITAITFTKKASAEMRERLNEKIESWVKQDEDKLKFELREIGINKNYDEYAKRAKNLFYEIQIKNKDIRISTFDSFFVEILSQFHLDKDIEKNFETNTDSNTKKIIDDVERKIFCKEYIINNTEFEKNINFIINYTKSFHSLKKSIREVINKKPYYLEIAENNNFESNEFSKIEDRIKIYQNKFISKFYSLIDNIFIDKFEILKNDLNNKNIHNEEKINLIKKFFLTNDRTVRKNIQNLCLKNNLEVTIFTDEIYLYENKLYNEIQVSWKIIATHFFYEYQRILKEKGLYDFSDKTWLCYKKLLSLNDDDWIFINYRGHAFYLAKGGPMPELFAELMGKQKGLSKGKAGSMHLASPEHRVMGASAVVGSTISHAVGAALISKIKNKKVSIRYKTKGRALNIGYIAKGLSSIHAFSTQVSQLLDGLLI